jgi:N-acetylglucosaminyldiphosphoundecaprenol N-acetyl-beta-D-mannosaminyltransferase
MMSAPADTATAFRCCGVRVDAVTIGEAVETIAAFCAQGRGRAVHLCNAWTLALARRQPSLGEALNRGDLNLPDGTPLTWIGRSIGFVKMRRRVYGPDLMLETIRSGRSSGLRHYLYGSTPEVTAGLSRRLAELAPDSKLVGAEAPPFRALSEAEEAELVERIHSARPHIVWVGLGTPNQDLFVDRFRDRMGAVLIAVGAAFDFISGSKPQAPHWMQAHGLEWAFRFATEPRRLWRRYLLGNASFVAGVLRGIERCNSPITSKR